MISIAFKTTVIVTFPHIPPSLLSDVIPVKVSADSYWMECLRGPQRAFMGEMGLTPRRSVKGEWAAVVERSRLRKRVFQVGEWETWSNKWSVQGVSSRWTTSIRCVVESGRKKKIVYWCVVSRMLASVHYASGKEWTWYHYKDNRYSFLHHWLVEFYMFVISITDGWVRRAQKQIKTHTHTKYVLD